MAGSLASFLSFPITQPAKNVLEVWKNRVNLDAGDVPLLVSTSDRASRFLAPARAKRRAPKRSGSSFRSEISGAAHFRFDPKTQHQQFAEMLEMVSAYAAGG